MLPYLGLLSRGDAVLVQLVKGLIWRQSFFVALDPYANAFSLDADSLSPNVADQTTRPYYLGTTRSGMGPHIFERKYELDSLCAFLKLSRLYFEATNDTTVFDDQWLDAVSAALDVMSDMQNSTAAYSGTYTFQRCTSCEPTDTLSHGTGFPGAATGLIRSCFRPSDDATLFPFNIASNAMAVVELTGLASLCATLKQTYLAQRASSLSAVVHHAIQLHGIVNHPGASGLVYAYEVDGRGNHVFMDDANIPSLLSLPLLGYLLVSDPIYQSTRAALLSTTTNPYYFEGSAGRGIGGPHVGLDSIWPMVCGQGGVLSVEAARVLIEQNSKEDKDREGERGEVCSSLKKTKMVAARWAFMKIHTRVQYGHSFSSACTKTSKS